MRRVGEVREFQRLLASGAFEWDGPGRPLALNRDHEPRLRVRRRLKAMANRSRDELRQAILEARQDVEYRLRDVEEARALLELLEAIDRGFGVTALRLIEGDAA